MTPFSLQLIGLIVDQGLTGEVKMLKEAVSTSSRFFVVIPLFRVSVCWFCILVAIFKIIVLLRTLLVDRCLWKKGWQFEMIICLNRVVNVYLVKILMFCANAARTLQRKENDVMVCNSVEESYNLLYVTYASNYCSKMCASQYWSI